jgi:two-component system, NtrC family, sensor histidine kinase HydH
VNAQAYALLGFTALVAVLVAVVAWALLRFVSAARITRHRLRDGAESPLLAIALQEGIQKLRAQERAMTERAEASEQLSTQIVNSLTAGLLVADRLGVVQILNPAGRKMLGIANVLEGTKLDTLPPVAAPLAGVVRECLMTGQSIVRRSLEIPKANEVTHVGVTVSTLGQSEAHAGGVICLFSDLTAVVALEEQLRLKETLARLGELTAGIAHEFRNGLATIHGYGKLIDPAALPPQYKPYIEGIRQETEALGQIVTNFLNFARPTQLSLAEHDLAAVVERAADDLRNEVQQLGGDILVAGQFGRVDADDVLLRQAFSNLLRNAIEACQPSGVPPRVRVEGSLDTVQGHARVSVHDNGPGLDPSVGDRIFQPFFTTKKTGTGLGLALVQKIIVTHNGRVTTGRSPSGGACFQVTLPLA